MIQLTPTPVPTKQQVARDALRTKIISGDFQPGDRLIIDQIARQLGMSAIPIREALTQLQREGLVTIRPHAGAVVSDVPLQAMAEIFSLLEALETAALSLVPADTWPVIIVEMERLCLVMESPADHRTWLHANRDFHACTPRLAGLSRILEALTRAGEEWERLRNLRFAHTPPEDLATANQEHREFVHLLRTGTLDQQAAWIHRHNRRALERYLRSVPPPEAPKVSQP